ncbi:MAG: proprotein convertase P-domain-containing protein [Myxococcota bacterium]
MAEDERHGGPARMRGLSFFQGLGLVQLGLVAVVGGCASPAVEQASPVAVGANEDALVEGTPEAVGTLRFLNDASTTLAVLDDDVPLNRRAAENLVAHRNGADGVFPSGDDDPFDDLIEVLDVDQVGPKRLERIAAYAASAGFVPEGDDLLGVYDDVPVTADEAVAMLVLVNQASLAVLDDEVPLNRRAADNIVAARPLTTVRALAEVPYVGQSALTRLRDHVRAELGASFGQSCGADPDCATGLFCNNIVFDAEPRVGRCADTSSAGVQEGNDCEESRPCASGLVCAGTTIYGGLGFCRGQDAMAVREVALNAPIGSGASVSHSLVIDTLRSVPEDVVIALDIDHPRKEDLVVTLTAASNTSASLWTGGDPNPPSYITETWGIERDNTVNGTWTVTVTDTGAGAGGTFAGFTLWVTSRFD